jgi:hypothetical protein
MVMKGSQAHLFFLRMMRQRGYSEEDCEAISRGMTLSTFKGELPSDKAQADKLIVSWLEQGRLQ